MSIEIFKGSILDTGCEALVNPVNSFRKHTGGLAAFIQEAAIGPLIPPAVYAGFGPRPDQRGYAWIAENNNAPMIPVGGASKGAVGHLIDRGFTTLIHAVGPIWGGGELYEHRLLAAAYDASMWIAENEDCKSIAFPAISAGIFGVPIDVVARSAIIGTMPTSIERVVFALIDDEHVAAFEAELARQRALYPTIYG